MRAFRFSSFLMLFRYLRKRAFEIVAATVFMVGMLYALFIVLPSLDRTEQPQFGTYMIILSIVFVGVYSIINNYLESRKQRKLDRYIAQKDF